MALVNNPYIYSVGTTIVSSQVNSSFSTIYNDYDGNITDANISSSAAIEYTKLALNNTIQYTDLTSATISSLLAHIIPSGVILMWSGAIATIPSGWVICDGTNSTPNLTNRFIIAADATNYPVGNTGNGSIPAHVHHTTSGQSGGGANTGSQAWSSGVSQYGNDSSSFGTGSTVIAIYYALCYIMKS